MDGRDAAGRTALMLAAARGYSDICAILLQAGASTDALDPQGQSAADHAHQAGHHALASTLAAGHPSRTHTNGTKLDRALELAVDAAEPAVLQPTIDAAAAEESSDDEWNAEPEATLPDTDGAMLAAVSATQAAVAAHRSQTKDADWMDDALVMPSSRRAKDDEFDDPALVRAIAGLLVAALERGSVEECDLVGALSGVGEPANDVERDATRLFLRALGDLGVVVDDPDPLRQPVDPALLAETVGDAAAQMGTLEAAQEIARDLTHAASGALDSYQLLSRAVARHGELLTPEGELRLAARMREALRNACLSVADLGAEATSMLLETLAQLASSEPAPSDDDEDDDLSIQPGSSATGPSALEPDTNIDVRHALELAVDGQPDHLRELDRVLANCRIGVVELGRLRAQLSLAGFELQLDRLDHWIATAVSARDQLFERNLRLVWQIARKYGGSAVPLVDRIQEGSIGLLRAVEGYDPSRGFRFSTYATWWIRQGVTRALADKSRMIRLPVHMHDLVWKLDRLKNEAAQRSATPSEAEIARTLEIPRDKVDKVVKASRDVVLFDDLPDVQWHDHIEPSLDHVVDPADAYLQVEAPRLLEELMSVLAPKERLVLKMRFGVGNQREHTLEEVGAALEVTRERARQIEKKALEKLKRRAEYMQREEPVELAPRARASSETAEYPEDNRQSDPVAPLAAVERSEVAPDQHPESIERSDPQDAEFMRSKLMPTAQRSGHVRLTSVLDALLSPVHELEAMSSATRRTPVHDLASRWFETYSPFDSSLDGRQHAVLHDLSACIRGAVRELAAGRLTFKQLLLAPHWAELRSAAKRALDMLTCAASEQP